MLLLAPTTTVERAALIAGQASGFVYYVSYKGITGAAHLDAQAVGERLGAIRSRLGELPVLVGFGIKDGASAAAIAPHADGVVVGSVLVHTMGTTDAVDIPSRLTAQVLELRAALDAL